MITFTSVVGFVSLQDFGRIGVAHLAIPRSGAFDRHSHDLANRIVGNTPTAASVEALRAHFSFVAQSDLVIAITGAPVKVAVDGVNFQMNAALFIGAGSTVEISTTNFAMRAYLAVRGGFKGKEVIGSVSYDELSRLGTPPIVSGSSLAIANLGIKEVMSAHAVVKGVHLGKHFEAAVSIGPRWEMFPNANQLFRQTFTISSQCNRVAVRLDGYSFAWETLSRLPSEGVVYGAIQVPVDGFPLIFGPDHPTTGGYPVVGVVAENDMSVIAQLPPGTQLRFRRT